MEFKTGTKDYSRSKGMNKITKRENIQKHTLTQPSESLANASRTLKMFEAFDPVSLTGFYSKERFRYAQMCTE